MQTQQLKRIQEEKTRRYLIYFLRFLHEVLFSEQSVNKKNQ